MILYPDDAHAILLLTHGPLNPKRMETFEAGRLFRMRGTKNGLNLLITFISFHNLLPLSRILLDASISSMFPIPVDMNTPYDKIHTQGIQFYLCSVEYPEYPLYHPKFYL